MVLMERTQYSFTVCWRRPRDVDADGEGDAAEITHYSIEIATTAPAGTYYPWQELWIGAGHASPDFSTLAKERNAEKRNDKPGLAATGREGDLNALKASKASPRGLEPRALRRCADRAAPSARCGGCRCDLRRTPAHFPRTLTR